MLLKTKLTLTAVAASLSLLNVGTARADTLYTTSVLFAPIPGVGLTVMPLSGSITGNGPANVTVADFTYAPTTTGSISEPFSVTEVLSGPSGADTVTISGTLDLYIFTPTFVGATFAPTGETATSSAFVVPEQLANYMANSNTTAELELSIIPTPGTTPSTALPIPTSAAGGLAILGLFGAVQWRRSALV